MFVTGPTGGKLVRDGIPEIIRADGAEPVIRTAGDAEIDSLLLAKLLEEVEEYADSREVEELADVVEVCFAAAARHGVSVESFRGLPATSVIGGVASSGGWVVREPATSNRARPELTVRSAINRPGEPGADQASPDMPGRFTATLCSLPGLPADVEDPGSQPLAPTPLRWLSWSEAWNGIALRARPSFACLKVRSGVVWSCSTAPQMVVPASPCSTRSPRYWRRWGSPCSVTSAVQSSAVTRR